MTQSINAYAKFHEEDEKLSSEKIINQAPSQNLDKQNEVKMENTKVNRYDKLHEIDEQNERNQVK